jgi:phosphomevalonate kinase
MKTLIIGIGHKMQRGKDTAAEAIKAARESVFDIRIYHFADALKEEIDGKEMELCLRYGIKPEPDNKWRSLMQFYGKMKRKEDPFYWIKKLMKKLANDKPQIALIADLRQMNEFQWVGSNEGLTIKVTRSGYRDLDFIAAMDESEVELDKVLFDYEIIVADGDIEELKKDAVFVFDEIVKSFEVPDLRDVAPVKIIEV